MFTRLMLVLVIVMIAKELDENCGMDCPTCHTPCIKHFSHFANGSKHACGNFHMWK